MSLYTELQEKLFNYLNPVCVLSGIDNMIFDYENGVQLKGDFVAIDIQNITTDNKPEVLYIQNTLNPIINDEVIRYRGIVSFGVDVYSKNQAIFIAEGIKANLWRGRAIEEAQREGLGFINYGNTQNLSAIQDGKFRHRAQFLMNVSFVFDHTLDETTVGTVSVKGDFNDGEYLTDITITE